MSLGSTCGREGMEETEHAKRKEDFMVAAPERNAK